ncbi:uncharacterized protein yc1106_00332 [Curvularia clavata]|uniref:Uncharacterized protein n=1 Tax=Curvularia clavata TaxID=95742 RepID=A0A9Q9DMZ4_CURCL|nr:uncharacterized protein yc1106_00332 [Curvularia clavata]
MYLNHSAQTTILSNIPPSDFKDLVDAAIRLHTDSLRFLQEINCFSAPDNYDSHETEDEHRITECQVTMARDLVKRHDDLGRHYGWVLAGDHASVDKALSGMCKTEKRPSEWFKEKSSELEGLHTMLKLLQLSVYETRSELAYIQA